jgi:hypothetical protein
MAGHRAGHPSRHEPSFDDVNRNYVETPPGMQPAATDGRHGGCGCVVRLKGICSIA